MESSENFANEEALLSQINWVRGLARSLVLHDDQVDDLSQEAMLAALENRTAPLRNPKAWLATVARHIAIRNAVKERNRRLREQATARSEVEVNSLETDNQLELHIMLVNLVQGLDEPYRSTVFLRFFEDLTPAQIAERLHLPPATVRTHLSRALQKLRSRLDREKGSRKAWCVALLALAGLDKAELFLPKPWPGTFKKSTGPQVKFAAVGLSILAISLIFIFSKGPKPPDETETARSIEPVNRRPDTTATDVDTGRSPVSTPPMDSAAPVKPSTLAVKPRLIRVAVTDRFSTPIENARVEAWRLEEIPFRYQRTPPTTVWQTDANGNFQFMYPTDADVFIVSDERIGRSLAYGRDQFAVASEFVITRFGTMRCKGIVLDEKGIPVAGAEIKFSANRTWDVPTNMGDRWIPGPLKSDSEGRFEADLCPYASHFVWAEKGNLKTQESFIAGNDESTQEVELRFPGAYSVSGYVKSPDGAPVRGAKIGLFGMSPDEFDDPSDRRFTETNAVGFFHAGLAIPGAYQIAIIGDNATSSFCGNLALDREHPRLEINTTLIPSKTISGQLVDAAGLPLAGVDLLAVPDETEEWRGGIRAFPLETYMIEGKSDEGGRFQFPNALAWIKYSIYFGTIQSGKSRSLIAQVSPGTLLEPIAISREMARPYAVEIEIKYPDGGTDADPRLEITETLIQAQMENNKSTRMNTVFSRSKSAKIVRLSKDRFRVEKLRFEQQYQAVANALGYANAEATWTMDENEKRLTITLPRPVNLQCRIVDRDEKPLKNANFSVRRLYCPNITTRVFYGKTDDRGVVIFRNIPPGYYSYNGSMDFGNTKKFRFRGIDEGPHKGQFLVADNPDAYAELFEIP